ncbi:MAG: hypothetical protein V2I32_12415 [Desulforhopalus sp.]|jgi:hypothetical protein|nr:hypothetical protein [Desulforhopalus sp.]
MNRHYTPSVTNYKVEQLEINENHRFSPAPPLTRSTCRPLFFPATSYPLQLFPSMFFYRMIKNPGGLRNPGRIGKAMACRKRGTAAPVAGEQQWIFNRNGLPGKLPGDAI